MLKKQVIAACGGAVATSTIAANKIVELWFPKQSQMPAIRVAFR